MGVAAEPTVADGRRVANAWLARFADLLAAGDVEATGELFLEDGYWRDFLALTWDLRTLAGPAAISAELKQALATRSLSGVELAEGDPEVFERSGWGWAVEAMFTFRTDLGRCRGHLRLRPDTSDEAWRAWTLFTSLEELNAFPEAAGHHRPRSTHPNIDPVAAPVRSDPKGEPEVLVIGAGQGGLSLAARLGALGVRTLVVEREERVGDNWRNRYQSLVLHNQVWANHLPYLAFPATWPAYIDKDQLADWLEAYASLLNIDVRTGTEFCGAEYSSASGRWNVQLRAADGTASILTPAHVVLATGVFGAPRHPEIPGSADFSGRFLHASEYQGGLDVRGRRALVVGAGTSAHDIAQDLHGAGAEVTMLQRSSTCVVSVDPGAARAYSIYREDGPPIEDSDLVTNSFPMPLVAVLHQTMTERIAELDRELLDGLRAAGFALDFGVDNSGFLMKYHRYGGGYYINVGCSDLIVSGEIQVKQGVGVARLTADGAEFTDGTSMMTDVVVVAAGYQNMSETVRTLFGDEVAQRVGTVWGLDEEGEVQAMWRRTGQPGFWIMGGSLQQCRPYSRYLALQIKGALEGLIDQPLTR
ncbi:MAG: flavin-containing monooxygenase [Mycobacteriales bacterium]